MKILRIIFACGILAFIASCVSSTPQVQPASTSPPDAVGTEPTKPAPASVTAATNDEAVEDSSPNEAAGAPSVPETPAVCREYDKIFASTVRSNWWYLINTDLYGKTYPGRVVLEFNLHFDGKITDIRVATNEVNYLQAGICEKAVLKGVPYPHWTDAMLKSLKTNSSDTQFIFNY